MQPNKAALAAMDADPLAFLVAPNDASAFLEKQWEQGPAVFKATPERRAFFQGLASFAELARLAEICDEEGEPLEFGVDVNAARYVDGKRETPNGEVADSAAIRELYHKEGCTLQFHQPQRFSEDTWRLLAALERQLGCLVGSNAYLTPKGTQGLAPHWDDVEIFVVQTEGSKRWRVYDPPAAPAGAPRRGRAAVLGNCRLANAVSGDLEQEEIGQAAMEFTLEVGDVLYMPRGTIHQAVAQGESSGHLTISTYQRWSAADLLQYTVSVALANPELQPLLPAPLKAGLPLRFQAAAGLDAAGAAALASDAGGFGPEGTAAMVAAAAATAGSKGGKGGKGSTAAGSSGAGGGGGGVVEGRAALARQLAAACRSLADCLEGDAELGPRLLQTAGDAMSEDFMRSRLPPHPEQLPPRGPPPTMEDSVQCVGSTYFRLVPFNAKDDGGCAPGCDEDHDHSHPHAHPGHAYEHEGAACGAGNGHGHGHGHGEDEEDEEEEEGEEGIEAADGDGVCCAPPAWVRLVSCLRNEREAHMMSGSGGQEEGKGGSDSDSDSGSDSEEEEEEEEESDPEVEEFDDEGKLMAAISAAAAADVGRKRKQPAAGGGEEEEDSEGDSEGGSEDEGSDGDEEEEEEEEENAQEDLVFPAEFAPALVQLLGSAVDAPGGGGRPLPMAAIALPDPDIQQQVSAALWEAGVLRTVKGGAAAKAAAKAAAAATAAEGHKGKGKGKRGQQGKGEGAEQEQVKQEQGRGKGKAEGGKQHAKGSEKGAGPKSGKQQQEGKPQEQQQQGTGGSKAKQQAQKQQGAGGSKASKKAPAGGAGPGPQAKKAKKF